MKAEQYEVVQEGDQEFWVWGFSVYPRGSALEGETRVRRVQCFASFFLAAKEFPGIKFGGENKPVTGDRKILENQDFGFE